MTQQLKDFDQFEAAVKFASRKHRGQKYGDKDYMYHLIQVDNLVCQVYGDDVENINTLRAVAYLHDVMEDCGVGISEMIREGFCKEVYRAVAFVTKVGGESYDEYIKGVNNYEISRKVKLCDTAVNLRNSIKEGNIKRINKYSKQIQLLGGF